MTFHEGDNLELSDVALHNSILNLWIFFWSAASITSSVGISFVLNFFGGVYELEC